MKNYKKNLFFFSTITTIISLIFFFSTGILSKDKKTGIKKIEIPSYSSKSQIIKHNYYTLKYNEKYEQAEWIAYKLTSNHQKYKLKRANNFRLDPLVFTGSATLQDYKNSGFDRGHLVPAADMKRSKIAMSESFFMSNMSPQRPNFNRGIWKKLESLVRHWVLINKELFIVTAGVLKGRLKIIGPNNVAVPEYFYKAILDYKKPGLKCIAFILPNKKSTKNLKNYAISIDKLEKLTGIDFFPSLPNKIEEKLESTLRLSDWPFTFNTKPLNINSYRCKGKTKKGHRCKRKVSNPGDYCSQHR